MAGLFGGHGGRQRGLGGGSTVPGYTKIKSLDKGGMSEAVSLVKKTETGKVYVEKRVRIDGSRRQRTMAELTALKSVERGRNLNHMHDFLFDERTGLCSFILEYCDGGSLQHDIEKQRRGRKNYSDKFVWHVLVGISRALAYVHQGIRDVTRDSPAWDWNMTCHLDLKPCNVFLSSTNQDSEYPRVVVGDFGCAIRSSDVWLGMEHPREQRCGTPQWYPPEGRPEMVPRQSLRYGPETDVWQMGATIHTMCRLLERPDIRVLDLIPEYPPCGERYGESLNWVARRCLHPQFAQRPTAYEMATELDRMVSAKGMRQLMTMRG
ncbi:hypothetical protein LTR08_003827 [Meristemomyces frigidus]|nr:hypothetical protein LTR08_003827 [Meristemomyces frigidus]